MIAVEYTAGSQVNKNPVNENDYDEHRPVRSESQPMQSEVRPLVKKHARASGPSQTVRERAAREHAQRGRQ